MVLRLINQGSIIFSHFKQLVRRVKEHSVGILPIILPEFGAEQHQVFMENIFHSEDCSILLLQHLHCLQVPEFSPSHQRRFLIHIQLGQRSIEGQQNPYGVNTIRRHRHMQRSIVLEVLNINFESIL